jgi:serine/threonine-protein kinase
MLELSMALPGDKRGTQARMPPAPPKRPGEDARPPAPPNRQEFAATQIGAPGQAPPPAAVVAELPPGMPVGEYRIEKKIGEGGMATVYAAVHPLIGKKAAIKVMSPLLGADAMAVERFIQEARAVNQIGHPNIVDIFSFGRLRDGRNYFVMEWLQGETLHARLQRGRMSLGEAVEILFHVCDALEAAHEKGIVHRDLKPENIFLVEVRANRKQVKLLDFGIAKLLTGEGQAAKVLSTNANVVMGTPQYISPEQARAKNVDHRTDIYSLGTLAYEMFLGRPPFLSDSAMAVVAMHLSDPVPPPRSLWPEVPPPIEVMLVGMLEKEPEKRPSLMLIRECLADVREHFVRREGDSGPHSTLLYGEPPPTPRTAPLAPTPTPVPEASAAPVATDFDLTPAGRGRSRWLLVGMLAGAAALTAILFTRSASQQPAAAPAPAAPAVVAAPPPAPTAAPAPTEPAAPAPAIVLINVNVDDARIELDGKVVAESARNARVEVPSGGSHDIVVSAPGRKTFKKNFSASSGVTLEVPVTLRSASSASPSRPAKSKPAKKSEDGFHMLDPFAK